MAMMKENQQEKQGEIGKCADNNCEICKLEDSIGNDWKEYLLCKELESEFKEVKKFLHEQKGNFYPQAKQIFAFTQFTKFNAIRVVIVGQDPYPQKGLAMGLCFSYPKGIPFPDSLNNIFKELTTDITGFKTPKSGDLTKWARQGVLLLNDVLTVEPGVARSHYGQGWEDITNEIVKQISLHGKNVVFMLWGEEAKKKSEIINNQDEHEILKCSHPSSKSANIGQYESRFIGCKHFSKANIYLKKNKKEEIEWQL